jgi:hypothetical protein
VYALAATFLVGGLARLVSLAAVDPPNTFFRVMTGIELLVPFLLCFMQSRVVRARNR